MKIPFASPAAARASILAAGGVESRRRHFEENSVYDTPAGDFARREALLRVRRTSDGRAVMTFKEKVASEVRAKVRKEWEVEISDAAAMQEILARAGFVRSYAYQKYRTGFRIGPAKVELDETPIGCFVEIEASPEQIRRVSERLGAGEDRWVLEDYRALHEGWCRDRGVPFTEMIFGPEDPAAGGRVDVPPEPPR